MAESLASEFNIVARKLLTLEADRAATEALDQRAIADKAAKCVYMILSLVGLVTEWVELSVEDEDDGFDECKVARQNSRLEKTIAGVESSMHNLAGAVKKHLDRNMQASLQFSEIYASEVLGLEQRIRTAQRDAEKELGQVQRQVLLSNKEGSDGISAMERAQRELNSSLAIQKAAQDASRSAMTVLLLTELNAKRN